MYHNELCNFPEGWLHKKKCDKSCEHWVTCTRKNSYEWEAYLKGLKHSKPTSNEQKQRELMDINQYHISELLSDIKTINSVLENITNHMPKEEEDND